jgi:hypothetical protein
MKITSTIVMIGRKENKILKNRSRSKKSKVWLLPHPVSQTEVPEPGKPTRRAN